MFYEHHRSLGDRYLFVGQEGALFTYSLHLHKSYELILVTEGELMVQIGGRAYCLTKGQGALIFPGRPHGYTVLKEGKCRIAIFGADYLPELKKEYYPVFDLPFSLMDRLYAEQEDYFMVKSILYELAALYAKGESLKKSCEEDALICNLAAYLDRHFTEALTLKRVAEKFGYNYRYMSGLVNRHFGASFPKVIHQFRINFACELLRKGEGSVTEIAQRSGFDSLRNFNRVFKKLTGKTPKEFKNKP